MRLLHSLRGWLLLFLALILDEVHGQAEVTVTSGRELQKAITSGATSVVITEHLDARPVGSPDGATLVVTKEVLIRGECSKAPSEQILEGLDPGLIQLKPMQCVILANTRFLEVRPSTNVDVVLDNLYVRVQKYAVDETRVPLLVFSTASVWISNTTLQGDRGQHTAITTNKNAALHISDSTLDTFNASSSSPPLLVIQKNSSAVFQGCTIRDITNLEVNGSAVTAGTVSEFTSSTVMIAGSTLENVTKPFFRDNVGGGGLFFADQPLQVYSAQRNESAPASAVADAGSAGAPFLRAEDRPLLAAAGTGPDAPPSEPPMPVDVPPAGPVPPTPPDEPTPTPPPPGPTPSGDDSVAGLAGGIAGGVVAAAVLAALALFLVKRHRTKKEKRAKEYNDGSPVNQPMRYSADPSVKNGDVGAATGAVAVPEAPPQPGAPAQPRPAPAFHAHPHPGAPPGFAHPHAQYDPYAQAAQWGQPYPAAYWGPQGWQPVPPGQPGAYGGPPLHHFGSMQSWASGRSSGYNPAELRVMPTTTITAGSNWSDFHKAMNESESPLDALEVALDAMCSMKAAFYGRYQLLSSVERRVGGQGVVQFASIMNTQDKAAIKFYMDKAAFQRERDLYEDSALKSMMPATLAIEDNASGEHATPYGYTFPPFVIIECGQSLDEWARDNANTDFITIFQAMSHSVRALAKLHSTGYAHRDIKPGNILRRPKQHDWTLIDFGCAAQLGMTAGLAYSLKYAPPEVMQALEGGCRTIHVDAAVDIWAIGVIAFELLTSERAFPAEGLTAAEAEKAAQDAIIGRKPLPWEAEAEGSKERLRKMRGLKRTVLRCLERDPRLRPSADALLKSWDHAFDDMQTRGTDWSMGSGETSQSGLHP